MITKRIVASHFLLLGVLAIMCLAVGCSEEPKEQPVQKTVRKAKKPVKKVEVADEVEPAKEEPKRFVYNPTGKRDPFTPLIRKGTKTQREGVPLTPLQRFDLGQFRLQAILVGKGAPRAMVSAPDGKTYILAPGIKIGKREGIVVQITPESVQVEETHYDLTGAVSKVIASIDMPEQKSF